MKLNEEKIERERGESVVRGATSACKAVGTAIGIVLQNDWATLLRIKCEHGPRLPNYEKWVPLSEPYNTFFCSREKTFGRIR